MLRQGWTSRFATIDIPEIDVRPTTGVLTRTDAYLSPLAARAIELIEQAFAERVPDSLARKSRGRLAAVR
jgi:hypothetical protein